MFLIHYFSFSAIFNEGTNKGYAMINRIIYKKRISLIFEFMTKLIHSYNISVFSLYIYFHSSLCCLPCCCSSGSCIIWSFSFFICCKSCFSNQVIWLYLKKACDHIFINFHNHTEVVKVTIICGCKNCNQLSASKELIAIFLNLMCSAY